MTTTCKKPFSDHPVHGQCTNHVGFLHTTVKDGKTFGWPDQVLTDRTKTWSEQNAGR